ncbi:MAG: radical SAM protein [Alphaproteobacteria bacterium]
MSDTALAPLSRIDPRKFRDQRVTADGQPRGSVDFVRLRTLWFNTGTLCNLTCRNCYIESSPRNDRLVYLTAAEVAGYLDEIADGDLGAEEIGFTGGEPFMNPDIVAMLDDCLTRGFRVLVLTNAMRPMTKLARPLLDLKERHGTRLTLRVSVDHYSRALHEIERGAHTWDRVIEGMVWLARNGFGLAVAGRTCWGEPEVEMRKGYARLFAEHGVPVDAFDPGELVLFPEMDENSDVPEITEKCWDILGVAPASMMCATSRMVIKRKGAEHPAVVACTLLPYDPQFELGHSLAEADKRVWLKHPHCARFCVLGGGSCSKA